MIADLAPPLAVLVVAVVTLAGTSSRERRLRVLDKKHDAYLGFLTEVNTVLQHMHEEEMKNLYQGQPAPVFDDIFDPLREPLLRVDVYGSERVRRLVGPAADAVRAADQGSALDKEPLEQLMRAVRYDLGVASRWPWLR